MMRGALLRYAAFPAIVRCQDLKDENCRPSYFTAVDADPKICGNRKMMNDFFLQDVERWKRMNHQIPSHTSFAAQVQAKCVRLVSWNINNLCGIGTLATGSVEPKEIAGVLQDIGADVIILQEALVDSKDYDDKSCEAACMRMKQLDALLVSAGYSISRSDHAQPVVIASRLPVSDTRSFNLDDGHQWLSRATSSPGKLKRDAEGKIAVKVNESRPLMYAEIQAGSHRIGVFGVHFHHVNYTMGKDGIRSAEAHTLLSRMNQCSLVDISLVAGDFNQPRKSDQPISEWKIVADACKRFKNPEDDGVAALLAHAGLRASWDFRVACNYPGSKAPPLTHWTGTTVDFFYLPAESFTKWMKDRLLQVKRFKLVGTYVYFTELSDHLPVVVDLEMQGTR